LKSERLKETDTELKNSTLLPSFTSFSASLFKKPTNKSSYLVLRCKTSWGKEGLKKS